MPTRIFNTIELKDTGLYGKMTILLASSVVEFIANNAGEFDDFLRFKKNWAGRANEGDTIKIESKGIWTEFNVRHISCIDISWPATK